MMVVIVPKIKSDDKELEIWLDLEGTVIDSWDNGRILHGHVSNIQTFLAAYELKHLRIWSFAIWTAKQKSDFVQSGMKESLEQLFGGLRIVDYPSVDEMIELCKPYDFHFRYECPLEFMQVNGKYWSFLKYAMSQTSKKCVLIDDCVPFSMIQYPNKNVEVITLNIEKDFLQQTKQV